jgi:hypothetical protein
MASKNKGPRKHHFVPQFYLKMFADSDERLWTYDLVERHYIKVHPKNLCFQNDLYTIDPEGTRNVYVEKVWFDMIPTALDRFAGLKKELSPNSNGAIHSHSLWRN